MSRRIADRLLSGYFSDADGLALRNVASRADIDTAMRLGAGHPEGPFAARGVSVDTAPPRLADARSSWNHAAVVGTGRMATGIAEAISRAGLPVTIVGRREASLENARAAILASLKRSVDRGRVTPDAAAGVHDRLAFASVPPDSGVDLVIEAVAEDLRVKRQVFSDLDGDVPAGVPIATNTSSFRVAEVRERVDPARPVLALHFFNPAPVMKLVEIVTDGTDPQLDRAADAFVRHIGKVPVHSADTRGFIVNRLLIPFLNDAVRLHEDGVPFEMIDAAIRADAGFPMGPFELIDMIGLDVTIAALGSMTEAEGDEMERLQPAATLHRLVGEGRLGRKSGSGFYTEGT